MFVTMKFPNSYYNNKQFPKQNWAIAWLAVLILKASYLQQQYIALFVGEADFPGRSVSFSCSSEKEAIEIMAALRLFRSPPSSRIAYPSLLTRFPLPFTQKPRVAWLL